MYYKEITTPGGLVEFCSVPQDPLHQDRCYYGLFYVIAAHFSLDETKMLNFCSNILEERQAKCFASMASRVIETDVSLVKRAAALCKEAELLKIGEQCYEELLLYSTYNFHPGSDGFFRLCNSLPEFWQNKCFAGAKNKD